jgi:TatD DNase family protein
LLALCESHPDVWCALGDHPHEARRWGAGDADRLAALLAHPRAVAVGECGLDFHYDFAPRMQQERAVREQWEVAIELGLPVVVHNRESDDAMLALVEEPAFASLRADFHSYAGGTAMARRLLARGPTWFGISGMVTFRKADNVREVLSLVPTERLLVETDTPYLAPVPHRGKRNEPAYVVEVARRLAEEMGLAAEELAAITTTAFHDLFARTRPPG